jgi:hypothetical protein
MNPKKGELKPKQDFPGSAGKGKLSSSDKVNKPSQDFPGSAGKGGLPKSNT